jgi:hypothetical protein
LRLFCPIFLYNEAGVSVGVIITGVPPYKQDDVVKENGDEVIAGCGPVAALMLLAYYDRRYGYKQLISTHAESVTGMPDALLIELRQSMHTVNDLKNGTEWGMIRRPLKSPQLTS